MKKPYVVQLPLYSQSMIKTPIEYVVGDREVYPIIIELLDEYKKPYPVPDYAIVNLEFVNREQIYMRIGEVLEGKTGKLFYKMLPYKSITSKNQGSFQYDTSIICLPKIYRSIY